MSDWFDTARLGMFIHWGHSSQRGIELSWPMAVAGGSFGVAVALVALAATARRSAARRRSAAVLREGRDRLGGVVRTFLAEPTAAVLDERVRVRELIEIARTGGTAEPSPASEMTLASSS